MSDSLITTASSLKVCQGALLTECCDTNNCIPLYYSGCVDAALSTGTLLELGSRYQQTTIYNGLYTYSSSKDTIRGITQTADGTLIREIVKNEYIPGQFIYSQLSQTGSFVVVTEQQNCPTCIPIAYTGYITGNSLVNNSQYEYNRCGRYPGLYIGIPPDTEESIVSLCRLFSNCQLNITKGTLEISPYLNLYNYSTPCSTGGTQFFPQQTNPDYDAFSNNGFYMSGIEIWSRSNSATTDSSSTNGTSDFTLSRTWYTYDIGFGGTRIPRNTIQHNAAYTITYTNVVMEPC